MSYMFAEDEKQIAEEWKKYAGYTVRPLPSTAQYYENLIKQHQHKKDFMIYGGTPEIRSIFQALTLPVTIVDRSPRMVRSLGLLTKAEVPIALNEKLVEGNWLQLDQFHHQFDLIIGDDAINMVEWEDFDIFLKNAASILKSDGVFICHLLVKPDEELIHQTFEQVMQEFNQQKIRSIFDLASRLNFTCFDPVTYAMGWQKTINTIGVQQLSKLKPALDFVDQFGLCNSQFYCPPMQEFEKLAQQYFSIQEIFYPHEHEYCHFEPVYVLVKN